MADYDGEGISDVVSSYTSTYVFRIIADAYALPALEHPNASGSVLRQAVPGWYSQMDGKEVRVKHYHKRGWRTESNDYVEWETTDRDTPYPGGGTVDPPTGAVVYQWVTTQAGIEV